MNHLIKCDVCGRFVSFDDLAEGRAKHVLVEPDSDRTTETYETLCSVHLEQTKIHQMTARIGK